MDGLNEVRAMAGALRGEGPVKERLAAGGRAFWSAMTEADHWPSNLKAQAEELLGRLLADGLINRTVAGLDEQEAQGLLEELLGFAERFEMVQTDNP